MTRPEGPAGGSAPEPSTPQPWPSENQAPPWAVQPAPPQWLAQHGPFQGPAAATAPQLVPDDGSADLGTGLSCDPVPHVAGGVSVLCRASDPSWLGIVRFTSTDGSFQVISVSPDGEPVD